MGREYGRVRAAFWDNEDLKPCAAATKMVALYLITSGHTNTIGCFKLPIAYISDDTNISREDLVPAFAELRGINYMQWCERVPWIWIPAFLKHNPPENPNVWRKCVKELAGLPSVSAVSAIAEQLIAIAREPRMQKPGSQNRVSEEEITILERYRNGIETVSADLETLSKGQRPCPLPDPLPDPDPDPDPEPEPKENMSADADRVTALRAYNDVAEETGWPKAQRLTPTRSVLLKARLRECGGIDGWNVAMAKARASPFLRGETGRDKAHETWVPDLDFFLQAKNFTKLMEGKYDQRDPGSTVTGFDALRAGARRAAGLDGQQGQGVDNPSGTSGDVLKRLASSSATGGRR